MSSGARLPRAEAYQLAEHFASHMADVVDRLKCVGSLRRGRDTVGDIEFIARPYFDEGFFGDATPILEPVRKAMLEVGDWIKGGQRMMQVDNLLGRPGARLDLYIVHPPANWHVIKAIRTGPAELGRYVVTNCRANGYRVKDGRALEARSGDEVPIHSEADFFALADLPCVAPNRRDAQAAEVWAHYRESRRQEAAG